MLPTCHAHAVPAVLAVLLSATLWTSSAQAQAGCEKTFRIGTYGYVYRYPTPPATCGDGRVHTDIRYKSFRCSDGSETACVPNITALTGYVGTADLCDTEGTVWYDCREGDLPKQEHRVEDARAAQAASCTVTQGDAGSEADVGLGPPSGAEHNTAGDPVELRRGVLAYTVTDLDLGAGLRFTRHYSSERKALGNETPLETAMGSKWRHSLQWEIARSQEVGGPEVVRLQRGLDTPVVFIRTTPGGLWRGPQRALGGLEGDFAGVLTYVAPDGTELAFDASDRLASIAPRGEPVIQVAHDEPAVGSTTYSNGSASLVIQHHTAGPFAGKVEQVRGNGVTIDYGYADHGHIDLASVTSSGTPAVGDEIAWTYGYRLNSNSLLALVQRNGADHASWDWAFDDDDLTFRVSEADEPALDQPLTFAYSTVGGQKLTEIWDTAEPETHLLATLRGGVAVATEVSGPGGPGYELGVTAGTHAGGRWRTVTDAGGHVTLFEDYDAGDRPQRIVDGWQDDGDGVFEPGVDGYARLTEYTWHPRLPRPLSISRASSFSGQPAALTILDYDADGDDDPNEDPTDLLRVRIQRGKTLDAHDQVVDALPSKVTYTYDTAVASRRSRARARRTSRATPTTPRAGARRPAATSPATARPTSRRPSARSTPSGTRRP